MNIYKIFLWGMVATLEAGVGRLWSKVNAGKNMRPYVKNKLKTKGLGV
jgi:hypothetical protein